MGTKQRVRSLGSGLLGLAAVIGCAQPITYRTSHGLRVRAGDVQESRIAVETATEFTIFHMSRLRAYREEKVRDVVWGLDVYVDPEPFECPWTYGDQSVCSGISGDYSIRYVHKNCIAASAFIHELIHYIQTSITKFVDYEHVTPELWSGDMSVENVAKWDTCIEVCPDMCMSEIP